MTGANQECFEDCVPDLLDKSRWLKSQQYWHKCFECDSNEDNWFTTTRYPYILEGPLFQWTLNWDINQHRRMVLLVLLINESHHVCERCMVPHLRPSTAVALLNSEYVKNMFWWKRIQKAFRFWHKINLPAIAFWCLIVSCTFNEKYHQNLSLSQKMCNECPKHSWATRTQLGERE